MDNCKTCSADPRACEYCIYNKISTNEEVKGSNDNIIFYNNIQDDNTSKKVCPICKKVYTDYPAISRIDNETLICTECGMKEVQEPFEELLKEYGIDVIKD